MLRKQPFPPFLQANISDQVQGPRTAHITPVPAEWSTGLLFPARTTAGSLNRGGCHGWSLLGPVGCWFRNLGKTRLRVPGLLEMLAVLRVGGLGPPSARPLQRTPCWDQFPSLVLDRTSRVPSWAESPAEGRGAAAQIREQA